MAVLARPSVSVLRLPWSRVIGYGCGDAGCNIAFQMTGLFLLIYYTDVVGLSPAAAAGIVGFVKLWDAFADIFAGRMVDRTMTRWGKFRPFILWLSLPLLLTNLVCFARARLQLRRRQDAPRDPAHYDVVINTSRIDLPVAVEIIVAASRG